MDFIIRSLLNVVPSSNCNHCKAYNKFSFFSVYIFFVNSFYDNCFNGTLQVKEVFVGWILVEDRGMVPDEHVHFFYAISHFRVPWNDCGNLPSYYLNILHFQ